MKPFIFKFKEKQQTFFYIRIEIILENKEILRRTLKLLIH